MCVKSPWPSHTSPSSTKKGETSVRTTSVLDGKKKTPSRDSYGCALVHGLACSVADKRGDTSRVTQTRRASATISFIDGRSLGRVPLPMPRHWKNTRSACTLIQSVNNFLKQHGHGTLSSVLCGNTVLLATSSTVTIRVSTRPLVTKSVSCGAHNMGASDGQLSPSQSSSHVTRQHVGRSCSSNPVC